MKKLFRMKYEVTVVEQRVVLLEARDEKEAHELWTEGKFDHDRELVRSSEVLDSVLDEIVEE